MIDRRITIIILAIVACLGGAYWQHLAPLIAANFLAFIGVGLAAFVSVQIFKRYPRTAATLIVYIAVVLGVAYGMQYPTTCTPTGSNLCN